MKSLSERFEIDLYETMASKTKNKEREKPQKRLQMREVIPKYPPGWFERREWVLRGRKDLKEIKHIPTNREIRKIERALGFKLYDWQKKYIKNEPHKRPHGRRTGFTTAYCIKLAMANDEPVSTKDLWLYADGYHGTHYDLAWFPKFFLDIWTRLHTAGLPVREIRLPYGRGREIRLPYGRG